MERSQSSGAGGALAVQLRVKSPSLTLPERLGCPTVTDLVFSKKQKSYAEEINAVLLLTSPEEAKGNQTPWLAEAEGLAQALQYDSGRACLLPGFML